MQQGRSEQESVSPHFRAACLAKRAEPAVLVAAEASPPILWPDRFPPSDWWGRFFTGIPPLGPSISFFRQLERRQAARTGAVLDSWRKPHERLIALRLGECLQSVGWRTPYFIPADQVVAIVAGPSFGAYNQQDLAYLLDEFNRRLTGGLQREFFNSVIDWKDPAVMFGELVARVGDGLPRGSVSDSSGARPASVEGLELQR